jgi:hypothetical protein
MSHQAWYSNKLPPLLIGVSLPDLYSSLSLRRGLRDLQRNVVDMKRAIWLCPLKGAIQSDENRNCFECAQKGVEVSK